MCVARPRPRQPRAAQALRFSGPETLRLSLDFNLAHPRRATMNKLMVSGCLAPRLSDGDGHCTRCLRRLQEQMQIQGFATRALL